MDSDNLIEIELLNGKHTLLKRDWDKVYGISEKTRWLFKLKSAFPFFKLEKQQYVKFKFRTHYEALNDFSDPCYRVKLTPLQLANLYGVKVRPFEQAVVENDLAYGV